MYGVDRESELVTPILEDEVLTPHKGECSDTEKFTSGVTARLTNSNTQHLRSRSQIAINFVFVMGGKVPVIFTRTAKCLCPERVRIVSHCTSISMPSTTHGSLEQHSIITCSRLLKSPIKYLGDPDC